MLLRIHGFQAFQAATWRTAQLDADTTHLQYLTMEDDRVRPAHQALDGVVLPKDDPFWETHTPPWDWGCRCRIRPLNPDQVALIREQDRNKPPEAQRVIEGPALEQLRHGRRITPEGQAVDVTPPSQKPGGENAFAWNPRDLELNLETLQSRYTPEVWAAFAEWAAKTEIVKGVTVYRWLSQPAALSRLPASLQDWNRLGLPKFADSGEPAPLISVAPTSARQRIMDGLRLSDPVGNVIALDARILRHWELETKRNPGDIQGRLRLLPMAEQTLTSPDEIWRQPNGNLAYLKLVGPDQLRALVVIVSHKAGQSWVRTYYLSWSRDYADNLRRGQLVYRIGRAGGQPPSPSGG